MNHLVIDLNVDTDYFDETLEELMEAQATQACWELVGDVEQLLSDFCSNHRWAVNLYANLEMATQAMEIEQVAEALEDIAEELVTDEPSLAALARKAFVAVRSQEFNLSTSL